MTKIIIRYGILSGIACSIGLFLGIIGKKGKGPSNPSYILIVKIFFILMILISIISVAIWMYRKKKGGVLELNEGLQIGTGITAVNSVIFSIAAYMYFKWYINNEAIKAKIKNIFSREKPEKLLEKEIDFWNSLNLEPWALTAVAVSFIVISGLIITYFASLKFKKSREKI